MTIQGKGFFTFNLSECEGGNPTAIVTAAKDAGLSHVIVKIADGIKAYGKDARGTDFTLPVVQALHAAGIAVWGWHYLSGSNPVDEAKIAIQRIQALDLNGYVINAESEYEQPGKEVAARQFLSALRGAKTIPIALCSYRFPNYHPEFPWTAFLEGCDYHMPKVFWEQAHNAGEQLRESKRQCDALPHARPYIPTGAAYRAPGWAPMPTDISDFLATAQSLGLPGVNFFQWEHCRKYLLTNWTAIANYVWSASLPGKPPAFSKASKLANAYLDAFSTDFIATLNTHKARQVAALYDPAAVRTWVNETLYGLIAIQEGYGTLFANLPAGVVFSLTQAQVDNDVHFISWKAGSLTGETTLVVNNGKIIQDYTFIS